MSITEEALLDYLSAFIWPFLRMSGLFLTMPIFGLMSGSTASSIPAPVKIIACVLMTITILPGLPSIPNIEIVSFRGWMVGLQQIMLGVSAGFILQMVMSVMGFAGQFIAYGMGLGFASMVDPTTGVQVPVIAQLFIVASGLFFLAVDGHLLLIEMLAQSFHTLPIAMANLEKTDLWRIIIWSGQIFVDGVLLSLPVMVSMLFINLSFGVVSKAAPQLQIFGVGFPITIIIGMALIWICFPGMIDNFSEILHASFTLVSQLLRIT
ncbi:MAG: flagellar biosynthetic protein FliR [Methylomonas sp.]|jgi:flagellar biosynthetic protein FliR